MKRAKKTRTRVTKLTDEAICALVSVSMDQFERHAVSPDTTLRILVYAVLQLYANAYAATLDPESHDSILAVGREMAPMVNKVFTSERPDKAMLATRGQL